MPIIPVVLVVIIVGMLMWLVNTYIPMASPIKALLNAVVLIVLILWILQMFGIFSYKELHLLK